MKMLLGVVAAMTTLTATDVLAQGANLTGRWLCVELCLGPPGSCAGNALQFDRGALWRRVP